MKDETLDLLEQSLVQQIKRLSNASTSVSNQIGIAKTITTIAEKITEVEEAREKERNNLKTYEVEMEKLKVQRETTATKAKSDKDRLNFDIKNAEESKTIEVQKIEIQKEANEDRAKLEREKMDLDRENTEISRIIEMEKLKTEWNASKIFVEIAKIGVPAAMTFLATGVWQDNLEKVLTFEKDNYIRSSAFKLLRFPNIFR